MKDDNTAAWERDDDEDHFECLMCHERIYDTVNDPAVFFPYCSRECRNQAFAESDEDTGSAW